MVFREVAAQDVKLVFKNIMKTKKYQLKKKFLVANTRRRGDEKLLDLKPNAHISIKMKCGKNSAEK